MNTNGFFGENDNEFLDLAQFDAEFEAAPVESRDSEPIEDGKYQAIIDKVELTRAHSSGNTMLKWTLRIIAPKHAGRLVWKNSMIVTAENVKWLKQDLFTCGLKLTKLSELPSHLDCLINVGLEITKKTKGENANVFFNRRIELAAEQESAPVSDGPVF